MTHFRITIHDAIFHTVDELCEAQSQALDHARELTRVVGHPVRVTVHRIGCPVRDDLGRDCSPAFFIGTAVGVIDRKQTMVRWLPAPREGAVAVKRRVAA